MLSGDTLLPEHVIKPIALFHDLCINMNSFNQVALTLECALLSFLPSVYSQFSASVYASVVTLSWPVRFAERERCDGVF